VGLTAWCVAAGPVGDPAPDERGTAKAWSGTVAERTTPSTVRLREGSTLTDALGEFHNAGDRIIFQPLDRTISLPTLENLALERVARSLEENPTRRLWSVTGTVTEYRGGNYLLITRARLKAKRHAP
jgi:hypothetical protein